MNLYKPVRLAIMLACLLAKLVKPVIDKLKPPWITFQRVPDAADSCAGL